MSINIFLAHPRAWGLQTILRALRPEARASGGENFTFVGIAYLDHSSLKHQQYSGVPKVLQKMKQ